jgi:hypothetical protein
MTIRKDADRCLPKARTAPDKTAHVAMNDERGRMNG